LGYLTLSRVLGTEQPFYKLQGPGDKVLDRPFTDAEYDRMALDYVRTMRAVQPEGPYYICGMCQGARIAFEMTRVLEAQGQKVGLLAIFDTWVVENTQVRSLWYLNYYVQRLKKFWKLRFSQQLTTGTQVLGKKAKRVGGLGPEIQNSWQDSYWPGKNFVPTQVNTPITIFKIPKQPYYYVRDPLMGWGNRTTKGVEIELVEAKHLLMLRKPWVRNLGKALTEHLRRANPNSSSEKTKPAEGFRVEMISTTRTVPE
jgi:thioesterase domain-containing protein